MIPEPVYFPDDPFGPTPASVLEELRELSDFLGGNGYFSRARALNANIHRLGAWLNQDGEAV